MDEPSDPVSERISNTASHEESYDTDDNTV